MGHIRDDEDNDDDDDDDKKGEKSPRTLCVIRLMRV